ncbi:cytochrome c oxidase subunit 2 (mitochondrion) [Nakaseomyces glabratus]|uniref:Cytochrome c oxidase polypeptide II n=1 Tax=Candida glabrata TaxID=5478 RepID=A0A0W0C5P2_CANGB|nr:cytochrome c oxidase subunit 2 [Nakaseomyces glabratus]KTA94968.1 cytochrome c oxidase subunit 2 [Nakaseomyces glabratus]KTA94983.1 cytochrome c oxidase subunit 2 [Nakaseomyces glabratus]KTA94993.1 cytochrome c oxidase subunit 2 [Nakaseomyces glabratus]KTA94999.1 cytochrome c oxidase subunit 2 [Nakaseomyces glabratus]
MLNLLNTLFLNVISNDVPTPYGIYFQDSATPNQEDTDTSVVVPVDTHIRFVVTGADVIHDFAIPSLGIKVDANPGRLNQVSALIQREGVFYGQCSELTRC